MWERGGEELIGQADLGLIDYLRISKIRGFDIFQWH